MGLLKKLAKKTATEEVQRGREAAMELYNPENPPWWWDSSLDDVANQEVDEQTFFFNWLRGEFFSFRQQAVAGYPHVNAKDVLRGYWREVGIKGV